MDATVRPRATVNATTEVEGENMLRGVLIAVCMTAPLATLAANAQTVQQKKMTACNKEAGTLKLEGDARKKFMSECLSG
jgi:psiF repeat